jgi:hypothetical protein
MTSRCRLQAACAVAFVTHKSETSVHNTASEHTDGRRVVVVPSPSSPSISQSFLSFVQSMSLTRRGTSRGDCGAAGALPIPLIKLPAGFGWDGRRGVSVPVTCGDAGRTALLQLPFASHTAVASTALTRLSRRAWFIDSMRLTVSTDCLTRSCTSQQSDWNRCQLRTSRLYFIRLRVGTSALRIQMSCSPSHGGKWRTVRRCTRRCRTARLLTYMYTSNCPTKHPRPRGVRQSSVISSIINRRSRSMAALALTGAFFIVCTAGRSLNKSVPSTASTAARSAAS